MAAKIRKLAMRMPIKISHLIGCFYTSQHAACLAFEAREWYGI
ncbi:hypothetical protein HMPREF9412_2781 [Paenibacillus sp. HGF5]|nr:hypothetical protein HMPREF9412_2781 [Paenibacillus sp. HGF5]